MASFQKSLINAFDLDIYGKTKALYVIEDSNMNTRRLAVAGIAPRKHAKPARQKFSMMLNLLSA